MQIQAISDALAQRLDKCTCDNNSTEQLVLEQIRLLLSLTPDITGLIRQINDKEHNLQPSAGGSAAKTDCGGRNTGQLMSSGKHFRDTCAV